jgi:hypothetical protein
MQCLTRAHFHDLCLPISCQRNDLFDGTLARVPTKVARTQSFLLSSQADKSSINKSSLTKTCLLLACITDHTHTMVGHLFNNNNNNNNINSKGSSMSSRGTRTDPLAASSTPRPLTPHSLTPETVASLPPPGKLTISLFYARGSMQECYTLIHAPIHSNLTLLSPLVPNSSS